MSQRASDLERICEITSLCVRHELDVPARELVSRDGTALVHSLESGNASDGAVESFFAMLDATGTSLAWELYLFNLRNQLVEFTSKLVVAVEEAKRSHGAGEATLFVLEDAARCIRRRVEDVHAVCWNVVKCNQELNAIQRLTSWLRDPSVIFRGITRADIRRGALRVLVDHTSAVVSGLRSDSADYLRRIADGLFVRIDEAVSVLDSLAKPQTTRTASEMKVDDDDDDITLEAKAALLAGSSPGLHADLQNSPAALKMTAAAWVTEDEEICIRLRDILNEARASLNSGEGFEGTAVADVQRTVRELASVLETRPEVASRLPPQTACELLQIAREAAAWLDSADDLTPASVSELKKEVEDCCMHAGLTSVFSICADQSTSKDSTTAVAILAEELSAIRVAAEQHGCSRGNPVLETFLEECDGLVRLDEIVERYVAALRTAHGLGADIPASALVRVRQEALHGSGFV